MSAAAVSGAGCYGKLPARGDFVARDLPRGFVTAWDGWLNATLPASRRTLGDAWPEAFLAGPVWGFVLGRGVIDDGAWAGVLCPSADRVGRCYPFTLAARAVEPAEGAAALPAWLAAAEETGLTALAPERPPEATFAAVRALC
ncbi:MAG: type VI secretion system-associated protein TagF, partial [Alphaproteobacteria bacterium]|nr:type VI secretion system-associated protein TagF [Alphaproteobacteria bacterium]